MKSNQRLSVIKAILTLAVMTHSLSFGWGPAHTAMTQAAIETQSPEFRALLTNSHLDWRTKEVKSLEWLLSHRFSMHPDWVDGPTRDETDIPERLRITQFVYGEREGKFMAPIAYTDPDKDSKGPRPKTYHYFMLKTEELNKAFARDGAIWYFKRISKALKEGRNLDAAEYLGAFAHAIEDRVSPYHVWDGYADQREAVEDNYPELQQPEGSWGGRPASASMIWALDGKGVEVDLGNYEPKLLGIDLESAAEQFTVRLFQSREHARGIYTLKDGYIKAHLQDDWKNREVSQPTTDILSEVSAENAKLVADVIRTAWEFSQKP